MDKEIGNQRSSRNGGHGNGLVEPGSGRTSGRYRHLVLLIGYRVIGKPHGDPAQNVTRARSYLTCKVVGWCILTMAIIGLLSEPFAG